MSKEVQELRRMASAERELAWQHAKHLRVSSAAVARAYVRRYSLAMIGAAFLVAMLSSRRSRPTTRGRRSSLPVAIAAVAVRYLPKLMRSFRLVSSVAKSLDSAIRPPAAGESSRPPVASEATRRPPAAGEPRPRRERYERAPRASTTSASAGSESAIP